MLIGRDSELAAIAARLAQPNALIVVRGEAGIGKSALVADVIRAAAGYEVHAAQALDFGQGRGEGPIATLVASLLGVGRGLDERRRAASATEQLASLLELEPEQPDLGEQERRQQQDRALAELVRSRPRPLIVVEDVHWADASTRSRLRILRDEAALVVTTRDWIDPSWGQVIELAPLDEAAANQLAAAQVADPEVIARCVARAGGNPLFLEQLIDAALHDVALPATLDRVVLARVGLLEPRDRGALEAAAVIGQHFTLDLVRRLSEDKSWQPDAAVARQLVSRSAIGDLAFHHALIRDGIYASLADERRRALHLAAAHYHARRDQALHAEHLDRAADPGAAMAWCAAAAAHVAMPDVQRALELIKRGVERATTGAARHALASLAGQLHFNIGDAFAAEREWTAALADAPDEPGRCRALIGIAGAHRLRVSAGSLALLDEAEPLAEAHDLQLELAQIAYLRGCLAFTAMSSERCRVHYQRALEIARRIGASEWEARALSGLGDALHTEGHFEGAAQAYIGCAELAKELGLTAYALLNRAMVADSYRYLLRLRDADRVSQEVAAAAGALGCRRAEAIALSIQASLRMMAWRFDGIEPYAERAIQRCHAVGMRAFESWMRFLIVEARTLRGDLAGARAACEPIEALVDRSLLLLTAGIFVPRVLLARDDELAGILAEIDGPAGGPLAAMMVRRVTIDRCLIARQWSAALHQVEVLERDARDVPYAKFIAARGRALAAWGSGDRTVAGELRRLTHEAGVMGFACPMPEVDGG